MGAALASGANSRDPVAGAPGSIERGRYIVRIGGCNDCHTPGFAQSGGTTPEKQWLTGDVVGFQGPWGTTYATNLRLSLARMTKEQWITYARQSPMKPPMPWPSLRDMTADDLAAIYRFVRYLGPEGKPAPAHVPPGQKAAGPVIRMVPE